MNCDMRHFTRLVGFLKVAGAAGTAAGLMLMATCFTGCGDPPITAQRVPKEKDPHASAAADPHAQGHGMMPPTRAALEWKLPAGWKEATTGRMALASFSIAGEGGAEAQVSVTALPNVAAQEADIVNMWRQQSGLPAVGADEALKSLQPVEVGADKGRLFDVAAKADGAAAQKRIVTAMAHRSDASWFYKLSGDAKTVEAQKPAFIEFLKSIRVKEAAAPASNKAQELIDAASKLVGEGKYQDALAKLKDLSGEKLSPTQQSLVDAIKAQIQKALGATPPTATDAAGAAGNLLKK